MNQKFLNERNLKSLRIFCAAAEAGGFAAAEKALMLSKASISRHVREVEEALNVKLCERGPGGFKLTVSGIAALKQAQLALDALSRIKLEVDNVRGALSGKLRIGIVEHIFNPDFDLPAVLREFSEQAPDVATNLHVMPFAQLNQAIRDRSLDVAIRGMYEEDSYYNFHPLFLEHQKLFALAGTEDQKLPLVFRSHPFIYDFLARHDYKKGPTASGLGAIAFLVASGKYVGILPEAYVKEVNVYCDLVEVKNMPVYVNTVCAIVEKYRPPSAAIDLFVKILNQHSAVRR